MIFVFQIPNASDFLDGHYQFRQIDTIDRNFRILKFWTTMHSYYYNFLIVRSVKFKTMHTALFFLATDTSAVRLDSDEISTKIGSLQKKSLNQADMKKIFLFLRLMTDSLSKFQKREDYSTRREKSWRIWKRRVAKLDHTH